MHLTIAIACYQMREQIGNTLRSLLPPYQRDIADDPIDIVLVDNGSPQPLPPAVYALSTNIFYKYIPPSDARPSPASALNAAVRQSRSSHLCLMIDGARLLSPGVISWGQRILDLAPGAMVEVRGWHLSPKPTDGNTEPEDIWRQEKAALDKIEWLQEGYRLFDIAVASAQTRGGFAGPTAESNCVFLSSSLFDAIGGFDERYAAAGGGLMNVDFFARAAAKASAVFTLLGEGTFHQTHGGAATSTPRPEMRKLLDEWQQESDALSGPPRSQTRPRTILAGHLPPQCVRWLGTTA